MNIYIQHKHLVDYPYDPSMKEEKQYFHFDEHKIRSMVADIIHTHPTCYLVSGYRGAGKTSFIRRVEEGCREYIEAHPEKNNEELLFVYSNFSRYENQEFFLRKLIRDLQEAVLATGKNAKDKNLQDLYKKTFYAVHEERANQKSFTIAGKIGLELTGAVQKGLMLLLPFALPLLVEFLMKWTNVDFMKGTIKWVIYVIVFIYGALKIFETSFAYQKAMTSTLKETKLADTDITNYYLEELIRKFHEQKKKLVFVLDELDKVDDDDFDKLLKEMKPWLVRGKADFIIVAGQKLTMRYYLHREMDDDLLASLFSKIVHVRLMPTEQLQNLFTGHIFKSMEQDPWKKIVPVAFKDLPVDQKDLVYGLLDDAVFRSRRVPRSFINLIRQDTIWSNSQSAYLPASINSGYICSSRKMMILEKLSRQFELDASLPETVKDHLVIQMFKVLGPIDCAKPAVVTLAQLLLPYQPHQNKDDKSNKPDYNNTAKIYAYPHLLPNLQTYLAILLQEAITAQLILPEQPLTDSKVDPALRNDKSEAQFFRDNPGIDRENEKLVVLNNEMLKKLQQQSTENDPQDSLQKFAIEFVGFVRLLQNTYPVFYPDNHREDPVTENTTLQAILQKLTASKVLAFPQPESPRWKWPLRMYYEKQNEGIFFERILAFFITRNVRIDVLKNDLLRKYVGQVAENVFVGFMNYQASEDIGREEQGLADWIFDSDALYGEGEQVAVMVQYLFVKGEVKIPDDRLRQKLSELSTLNKLHVKGNIAIQVVIFDTPGSVDTHTTNINLEDRIEFMDLSLAGKLKYFVLPVSEIINLQEEMKAFAKTIFPYQGVGKSSPASFWGLKTIDAAKPDKRKGMFGGEAERNGRKLTATVTANTPYTGEFYLQAKVVSTDAKRPLFGPVEFSLDEQIKPHYHRVQAKDGVAEIKDLKIFNPFTIGVKCDNNETELELDLRTITEAPDWFRDK